jgi:hypothetical protein
MAVPKKRWNELSGAQRGGLLALIAVQAVIVALAQRDLSVRSDDRIRGPRALWRVVTLQTAGAVAYLVVGRKP